MIIVQDSKGKFFSEFGTPKLGGTTFPVFTKTYECQPAQIAVYHNDEDAKNVIDILNRTIEGHRMLEHRHGTVCAMDLSVGVNVDGLRKQVELLESLRPHWAQGYSSDGQAAQAMSGALSTLWKMLGAKNQTEAVIKLKALLNND